MRSRRGQPSARNRQGQPSARNRQGQPSARNRRGQPSARNRRGQLSLTVVEAAIGVVLILGVAMGFALAIPGPADQGTQLDAYARDGATVLANEPPRHADETRLSEVVRSEEAFEREGDALERRVDRILPDNLLFRVITPHGEIGYRQPDGIPVGVATATTTEGDVRIEVWYV